MERRRHHWRCVITVAVDCVCRAWGERTISHRDRWACRGEVMALWVVLRRTRLTVARPLSGRVTLACDTRWMVETPAGVICLFALCLLVFRPAPVVAQSLRWDGTGPFCGGTCVAGETELTRLSGIPDFWVPPFVTGTPPFGSNCLTGTKALCVATPGSSCRWDGTAPFCNGSCRSTETQARPPGGSSSGSSCWTGSKVYCCTNRVGSVSQPLTGPRDCSLGADTCIAGFVWREANPSDHVCVTPQVRQQTRSDNAQAGARRMPGGGPFGPDSCKQGFVWREAFVGDRVCVAPQTRTQAAMDRGWSKARDGCP